MDRLRRWFTSGWARYRSWPGAVQAAVAVVVVFVVLGAILGEPPEERDVSTRGTVLEESSTTTNASPSTTTATPSSSTPTTARTAPPREPATTTVTTAASTSTLVTSRPLTGFGATRAAWDAAHRPAPGRYTPGSAYGPLLDGRQPTYAAVIGDEHILSFSYYAPARTSVDDLRALIRQEFPSDAELIDSYSDGDCRIEAYKSRALEQSIGPYTMVVAYPSPERDSEYRDAIFTIGKEGERDRC